MCIQGVSLVSVERARTQSEIFVRVVGGHGLLTELVVQDRDRRMPIRIAPGASAARAEKQGTFLLNVDSALDRPLTDLGGNPI